MRSEASITLKYVHGPAVDAPLAVDDGTALSYYHADGLGSVVKTTNTAGAVTLTRQYDAWGISRLGEATSGYAFTGREWDPETGLYYYRTRYYDTATRAIHIRRSRPPCGGGCQLLRLRQGEPDDFDDPSRLEPGPTIYAPRAALPCFPAVSTVPRALPRGDREALLVGQLRARLPEVDLRDRARHGALSYAHTRGELRRATQCDSARATYATIQPATDGTELSGARPGHASRSRAALVSALLILAASLTNPAVSVGLPTRRGRQRGTPGLWVEAQGCPGTWLVVPVWRGQLAGAKRRIWLVRSCSCASRASFPATRRSARRNLEQLAPDVTVDFSVCPPPTLPP